MMLEHDHIECQCDSDEHFIRVSYFVNKDGVFTPEDDDEIYVSVQLPRQPIRGYFTLRADQDIKDIPRWQFWRRYKYVSGRLWKGIKYIFGYQCKYGYWETTIIKYDDAIKLRTLLDRYIHSGLRKIGEDI